MKLRYQRSSEGFVADSSYAMISSDGRNRALVAISEIGRFVQNGSWMGYFSRTVLESVARPGRTISLTLDGLAGFVTWIAGEDAPTRLRMSCDMVNGGSL